MVSGSQFGIRMRKTLGSSDHERFLELLVHRRREAGLTQIAVAERLERPQSFVAKYENGERRLDVLQFIAVARALGSESGSLLGEFVSPALRRLPLRSKPSSSSGRTFSWSMSSSSNSRPAWYFGKAQWR